VSHQADFRLVYHTERRQFYRFHGWDMNHKPYGRDIKPGALVESHTGFMEIHIHENIRFVDSWPVGQECRMECFDVEHGNQFGQDSYLKWQKQIQNL